MSIELSENGTDAIIRELEKLASAIKNPARALKHIGFKVQSRARLYAPIGPTDTTLRGMSKAAFTIKLGQVRAQMRADGASASAIKKKLAGMKRSRRRMLAAAKARRKPGSTSRPKPGSLQNSISIRAATAEVAILVPSNSPAGKYAWKIHNEKGQTWRNRGPGTVAKGVQADTKFIERAISDLQRDGTVETILRDEIAKQAGL